MKFNEKMGKSLIISFLLIVIVAAPSGAQNDQSGMGMMEPAVIAKPSFETIEGGLQLKVWIMSIISDEAINDTNDASTATAATDENKHGTHHVMVEIKDAVEGKGVTEGNVKLEILSPSGNVDIIDLETMAKQFGGDIPLEDKGEYKLNLVVSTEMGRKVTAPFSYKVN
jgi:hypothetical protein